MITKIIFIAVLLYIIAAVILFMYEIRKAPVIEDDL